MGDDCADCQELREKLQQASDEVAGHLETIRRQSAALGRARRVTDPEKKAREHDLWDRCGDHFKTWQRATGHLRSKFTADRFRAALPFLNEYEDTMIERAIAGIAYEPYEKRRKNGTLQRYDSWATLFKSADSFEEMANRAPLNWRETLERHAEEVATRI